MLVFLGEWFGGCDNKVILPAKMTREGEDTKVSTRKFVQIDDENLENFQLPILKVHQRLSGTTKPLQAMVLEYEIITLEAQSDIDAHNLKKMRSAMNMLAGQMGDSKTASKNPKLKAGYAVIKKKFKNMENIDTTRSDIRRYHDHVKALLNECEYVFDRTTVSESEKSKRSKAMMSNNARAVSGQMQNCSVQRNYSSRKTTKSTRSTMQMMVKQTDYSRYSDEED